MDINIYYVSHPFKTARENQNKGHLSPDEMNKAAMNWTSVIQQDLFREEIKKFLKSNKRNQLNKQFGFCLDDKEIIRCDEPTHNSTFAEEVST